MNAPLTTQPLDLAQLQRMADAVRVLAADVVSMPNTRVFDTQSQAWRDDCCRPRCRWSRSKPATPTACAATLAATVW